MAAKALGTWRVVGYGDMGAPGDLTQIDAAAAWAVGKIVNAVDIGATAYRPSQFVYAGGVASCAAKDAVVIKASDGTIVRGVARAKGTVGIAQGAIVAGKFGWVQIKGEGAVATSTVAADAQVYLTAAAGVLDDAVVAGDLVYGMTFTTADDTSTAVAYFPDGAVVGDTDNA